MERMTIKFVQGFCGKRYVLEFNETHRTVLLRPEAQPFVATLLGKHGLELVLRRVDREVTDI